jgi:hypothetical protein
VIVVLVDGNDVIVRSVEEVGEGGSPVPGSMIRSIRSRHSCGALS